MSLSEPDKLDTILDSAMDEVFSRPREPETKNSLDDILSKAIDGAEEKDAEYAEFQSTRDIRNDMRERFSRPHKKSEISDVVESFLTWDEILKADPLKGADIIAGEYLTAPQYLKLDKRSAAKPAEGETAFDKAFNAAYSKAEDEAEYKATADVRAKLKERFPHLSFAEALGSIQKTHNDLLADPVYAAGQLAAAYGVPVTKTQHAQVHAYAQQTHELGFAEQIVEHASKTLPQFDALYPTIVEVLQDPEFVKHPKDYANNLTRAYQVALYRVAQTAQSVAKAKAASSPKTSGTMPQAGKQSLDDMIRERL